MASTVILIPARLQATRLPNKPMALIAGEPMIVHVWRRACAAEAGRVVVATDAGVIADAIRKAGGEAVMTRNDHISGSDRIYEALNHIDPDGDAEYIVNLQGDLPTLEPRLVISAMQPLLSKGPDIATLAAEIKDDEDRANPNIVKVVGTPLDTPDRLRALYFTRAMAPAGDGPLYHHIGIYAYRRAALERFISFRPTALEIRERLEQLRAIESGMRIDVSIVDTVPLGVDTPADLVKAKRMLEGKRSKTTAPSPQS